MTKHRTDVGISGQPVPQSWFQTLMEYISTLVSNVIISLASSTSIQVVAGAGSQQVGLGINGKWRYNAATTTVAHPGGAAGPYDIYAVASDNLFSGTGTGEVDTTDYTFGLAIVAGGAAAPTGVYGGRAIAHTRKIGTLTWSGTAISDVQQTVGSGGLSLGQISAGILLAGTLAARPTASGSNTNYYYFASDSLGGIIYRSTGSAWVQMTAGVVHATVHAPGGTDPLPWTTINGYGTFALRPAAASTNAGYLYFATDTLILYRSNGTTWDSESAPPPTNTSIAQAIHLAGTLASRPAAAAGNAGFYYDATDTSGGTLYQSNGTSWTQIAAPVSAGYGAGIILDFAGPAANAPAFTVPCDGGAYTTTSQPALFARIGNTWNTFGGLPAPAGGSFRVPDLRGRGTIGLANMSGGAPPTLTGASITRAAASTLASLFGEEFHTLTVAEMPSHNHGGVTGTNSVDHTHTGTTGTESADHIHSGNTGGDSVDHQHVYTEPDTTGAGNGSSDSLTVAGPGAYTSGVTAFHTHAFSTGGRSAAHTHSFTSSGASVTHTHSVSSQGGGGAAENTHPVAVVNKVITTA